MVIKKQTLFALPRFRTTFATLALLTLSPAVVAAPESKCSCTGETTPLPLEAKTPQDLAFKAVVERHYLMVNLLTSGRAAMQRRDHEAALKQWETLANLPDLPADIDREVQAALGQLKPGAQGSRSTATPVAEEVTSTQARVTSTSNAGPTRRPSTFTVDGRVAGGGARGPAHTVVWLKPLDGTMPPLRPVRRVVHQRNKSFLPHVVVVPVGGRVAFVNDDEIHHNVFSSTEPNDFDSGLYGKGGSFGQLFNKPGPVEILCNIHANMGGYVFVVESPYYAVANASGQFHIPAVPPGRYRLEAWHELSSKNVVQTITVGAQDASPVLLTVLGDKAVRGAAPDKYGRPRQEHIGY